MYLYLAGLKAVPDCEGYYITKTGTFYSSRQGRLKKRKWSKSGKYNRTMIWRNGARWNVTAHRLVLLTWIGGPTEAKPYALHRDGDPQNNSVVNLYWGSNSDNTNDSVRHGTHAGARNGQVSRRFTRAQEAKVRSFYLSGNTMACVADVFDCSVTLVCRIVHKRRQGDQRIGQLLDAQKVRDIRRLLASGETTSRVAALFKVKPTTVSAIKARRIWASVQ